MMHAFLLAFFLCSAADQRDDAPADACEEGRVWAASCRAAEQYIRAGMRAGQVLHVMGCEAASVGVAGR